MLTLALLMLAQLAATPPSDAAPAEAFEAEGVVRIVGSAVNAEVTLVPEKELRGPAICDGPVAKRVSRLSGMSVKVKGPWKLTRKGKKDCIETDSFVVTKTSSGREAVVGKLAGKKGVFEVVDEGGKSRALQDIPGGLAKLDGKKVILDLKQVEGATAQAQAYKVVTYAAFPE